MKEGYQIPFLSAPPLSLVPKVLNSYKRNKEKLQALKEEVKTLLLKEAIEVVQGEDAGFYNRLFLVPKENGEWRPVLDVSGLNKWVKKTHFSMESSRTVLQAIQPGDWMITIDMKDAYFHIQVHPDSRRYLRFVFNGVCYQFRAMCFGLSTAPQVFTRVLAVFAKLVHLAGFRMLLYLDDWLILAQSKEEMERAKVFVLNLARQLGLTINVTKSSLSPAQEVTYLGMIINSNRFWVSPTQRRVQKVLSTLVEFRSSEVLTAKRWLQLLGLMSSLEDLVEGSRLRTRPFQFHLKEHWCRKRQEKSHPVPIPLGLKQELEWWLKEGRLEEGLSLRKKPPDLVLFSDASKAGWGATIGGYHFSGLWTREEGKWHINNLELLAVWKALKASENLVTNRVIAVHGDNTTALSYIAKKRRNKIKGSVPVNKRTLSVDRREERHPNYSVCAGDEEFHSRLPQQEESSNPNRMDTSLVSMSRSVEEVGGTDGGPFRHCLKPSTSFVLLSSLRPKSSRSGCNASRLEQHGSVCLPSVCNDQTSHKQTKEFKEHEDDPDRTLVASEGMVPGPSGDDNRPSSSSPAKERLVKTTSQQISAPKPPHASASRVETVHRLIRARGFSGRIARSIFGARGPSTNKLYQHQWETYFKWCKENKISSTRTSVSSICEFLWYLRYKKKLAVPTIKGYRAMLSSVLRHVGLDFSSNKDIQDLIKAFQREVPRQPAKSLSWNLDVVLKFLCSSKFEPLTEASELRLTQKTLFLIALALAKRVSELQAMSRRVGFSSHEAHLSLLYSFRAKNDNKCKALPRSFVIKDLASLVGEEEERLLCPVRALKIYLKRTKELVGKSHDHLFAGVKKPERPLSKNGISYYIRSLIREAHSECNPDSYELLKVRTHEVRGVGTSFNFVKNMSLEDVMNAAQWRCNGVFASHYFRDISVSYDDCRRLGPFVAAGTVIS